jgi:membrane associated rhomboid family serine protease
MSWREAPATVAFLAATVLVSAIITLTGNEIPASVFAGFIPYAVGHGAALPPGLVMLPFWLTPLSATFVHAGFVHLALNMVMLGYCGFATERALGWKGVVILYLVGAYAAAVGQYLQGPDSAMPMIGASGAISAIIAAYALLYGQRRAKAIGPFPASIVHAAWLAAAWIGIQVMIGLVGIGIPGGSSKIAIGAHIGGFIAGLLLERPLLLWRYRRA